jgi:hypothetical protein
MVGTGGTLADRVRDRSATRARRRDLRCDPSAHVDPCICPSAYMRLRVYKRTRTYAIEIKLKKNKFENYILMITHYELFTTNCLLCEHSICRQCECA